MAEASIRVNERTYRLGCEPGEEPRLAELAKILDRHVVSVGAEFGKLGDERLLLMAGLMVADELLDARARIAELEGARAAGSAAGGGSLTAKVSEAKILAASAETVLTVLTVKPSVPPASDAAEKVPTPVRHVDEVSNPSLPVKAVASRPVPRPVDMDEKPIDLATAAAGAKKPKPSEVA